MAHFTLQVDPAGPILSAIVAVSEPRRAALVAAALIIPPSKGAPLILQTIPVVSSDLSAQGLQALVGRDILRGCLFSYNGDVGLFTLAF